VHSLRSSSFEVSDLLKRNIRRHRTWSACGSGATGIVHGRLLMAWPKSN